MKKTLKQTIILFIVLNLITAAQVLAQDVIEEENQEVPETQAKEAEIEQKRAEIAAKAAEKQAEIAAKEAEIEQRRAEIAAKVAEKDADIAASVKRQLEATEQQMREAEKQVRKQQLMLSDKLAELRLPKVTLPHLPHLQDSVGGVLVIPSGQMKVEDLAAITEDMSVMSRILDKMLNQSDVLTARGGAIIGLNPYLGRSDRLTEAIYLEGYGALFLIKVSMLLSAPPESQQEEKTEEADTDPVWTQMRREMYEPEEVGRSRTDDRPEEKYDAEKVENLKTNLIKTLKHAANIRALNSDDLVILTVIGDGGRPASTVTRLYSYGRSTGRRRIVQTVPEVEADSVQPTVLTICAKKSDIDAFAKGELDYDQFRQRIEIFKSYAKAGQQASPGAEVRQVAHEVHPVF